MESITKDDVILLANALSIKSGLNVNVTSITQCTSDFALALYLAIMGELPAGAWTDSTGIKAREHNVSCIVNSLADDYLHIDLSHISPSSFVAADAVTIFNLFEILDGLLDFMLEQIEVESDSGEEGDIDSDISSIRKQLESNHQDIVRHKSDVSSIASDLNAELSIQDLPSRESPLPVKVDAVTSPKSTSYASWDEEKPDKASEKISTASLSNSFSETYVKPREQDTISPPPMSEQTFTVSDVGEPHPSVSTFHPDTAVRLDDNQASPRPMLVDSLKLGNDLNGERILEDMTNSLRLRQSSNSCNEIPDMTERIVVVDPSNQGPAISISDFTSESSKSEFEPQPAPTLSKQFPGDNLIDGVDVTDGIPKPEFHRPYSSSSSDTFSQTDQLSDHQDKDWMGLLDNLQKTVEESKRIREKYFATPKPSGVAGSQTLSDVETKTTSLLSDDFEPRPVRQRNVRFEDTVLTETAQRMEDFKKVLQKEKDLRGLKNKILSTNYQDHLDEVEEGERRKMKPLLKHAKETQKQYQRSVTRQRTKKATPSKPRAKKDLAAAARWKSWQSPFVVQTPKAKSGKVKRRIDDRLVIGEHDLLPILISEFPGLELSSTTLNNAWKKQFRQIEMLTKSESDHSLKKRLSEKKLEEAHNRHELLIELMRKEHEHNQRVRDAKERALGEQEAVIKIKERRQQSARVRRYYRDYQLQMRARMLKKRTREEKLFKNLFEEGLKIQRSRLNDIRRYARDKRTEQQMRQRNEIASLENYYKDQFAMLSETLESEKKDLKTRNNAQSKLLRQMTSGLRRKMEDEITNLQEQIARDDDDIYYRELEADRIRRQLQLATYNAKFHESVANKLS